MDEYLALLERMTYEQTPDTLPAAVRKWVAGFRKVLRTAGDDLLLFGEGLPPKSLPAKPDSPSVRAMKADEARTPRDWQKRMAKPKAAPKPKPKGG